MQAEQIGVSPPERLGLLTPSADESTPVVDYLLPLGGIDVIRTAVFEFLERTTKTT